MNNRGNHTYEEIMSQPVAWQDAIDTFFELQESLLRSWTEAEVQKVLFTGCGSTYYLATVAASLFSTLTGITALAFPGSELMLFPQRVLKDAGGSLLVTISRSGTTTETIRAQEAFRKAGGATSWCITCYPDSPLAENADLVFPAVTAQEQSIAQTRSFASMLVLAQLLAAAVAGDNLEPARNLPQHGAEILRTAGDLMAELGRRLDFERLIFLGSSHQYGVASEAMLKMTEMSLSFSSAFHFLEYRHGPMSLATEKALISGLLSAASFEQENKVLKEMAEIGAQTLAINPLETAAGTSWELKLPAAIPAWARPVLYLPPMQLLAYHRAMAKGLDPDNPQNLTAVVYLE